MGLSVNQARNFYLKNRDKFPGMNMTQAVEQLVRGEQAPTPPVTAAPAATAPGVPVAPVAAAPAPEAAPAPQEQPYMNQYESALAAYNLANPEAPAPAPGVKAPKQDLAAQARQAAKERQRQSLEENVEIARNAKIDPETQKLIDQRLERYGIQLTEADKDRQQATWMAVAQAGLKMAQSQSPYFMQALASGMEAGLDGFSEAKAKAAEKKARLQDAKEELSIPLAKEELSMKAIELRAQAVKDAIAARQAAKQGALADAEIQQKTLAGIIGEQTAADVVEAARLGNEQTRAQIANIKSVIGERAAAGRRAEAAARGGGGGIKLSQLNPVINGAISENNRLTEQLNDPVISSQLSPAEKRSMQAKIQSNNQIIQYGRSLQKQKIGMGSGFKILGPA